MAVSILLDLDIEKIIDAPDDEKRMARFLTMVKRLPSNIIFTGDSRLNVDGFRWAPKTFLMNDATQLLPNENVTCTNLGLFGEYLAFTPLDSQVINFSPQKRYTIIEENSVPCEWFDV